MGGRGREMREKATAMSRQEVTVDRIGGGGPQAVSFYVAMRERQEAGITPRFQPAATGRQW